MELEKFDGREKDKAALKIRITLFFIFFLVAVFVVFMITSVLQINTVTRYVCSRLAMPTVRKALNLIDPQAFKRLTETMNEQDPYYETARKQLLALKEETNVQYLYTMAPEEGSLFRYVIDGSAPPEDTENFSPIGAREDLREWEKAAMDTVLTKTGRLGGLDRSEVWGATISAYEPILDESGELIGIVGCDINGDDVVSWIHTQVLWQFGIVAAFILAGLAVYINLLFKLNRSFI